MAKQQEVNDMAKVAEDERMRAEGLDSTLAHTLEALGVAENKASFYQDALLQSEVRCRSAVDFIKTHLLGE